MIWSDAEIVVDGNDRSAWHSARRHLLTSTDIARGATPSGFQTVIEEKILGTRLADFSQFQHGRNREQDIAELALRRFGIAPSKSLYARGDIAATPDGVSVDTTELGEYKTSLKPLPKTTPRIYRDQVYVAQYVLGGTRTVLGWEQHINGVPSDLEPTWRWIDRDDERIAFLLTVADRLRARLTEERLNVAY